MYFIKRYLTLRKTDIELIKKLTLQDSSDELTCSEEVLQYKRILERSAAWEMPSTKSVDFAWLAERIEPVKAINRSFKTAWMMAASVSLLILAGMWVFNISQQIAVQVPLAQIQTIWLPDSSKVILNAGAKLKYSKVQWANENRSVDLAGVAYFEVKKGSRFTVNTSHGQVAVLGTSFNVKAFAKEFIVECITGKVGVTSNEEKGQVLLLPGFKTQKDQTSDLLIPSSFDLSQSKEWLDGVFNFRNQSMDGVWEEFERQFDIEVSYHEVEPRFYTGTFSNKDRADALSNICKPMGLTYEIDENKKLVTIRD